MLLELENARLRRSASYRLRIEKLALEPGERLAITGSSGCGKSTALDIIGMILSPDCVDVFKFSAGSANYNVAELWKQGNEAAMTEFRRRHLGYVLQTGEIFAYLNVRENIALTAQASGASKAEALDRTEDLMRCLGLERLASAMPATLSIGERQRVAIARALAPKPALILADEPTSALDPGMARDVMGLMLETLKLYGAGLIMVSHDLALVSEFGFPERRAILSKTEDGIEALI